MRFYVLRDPPSDSRVDRDAGTEASRSEDFTPGDALRCPACDKRVSMLRWLPPYNAEIETWGREFGDLAYMGFDEILVSLRFKALWEEHGLTGLARFDPVNVVKIVRRRKLVGDPPCYYRSEIARSRAAIDQQASEFVWQEPPSCDECRRGTIIKRWRRIILEPDTWTGEDVFQPRGLAVILATQKFKEFCESYDIKNAYFVPAELYAHDFYPWETRRISESN